VDLSARLSAAMAGRYQILREIGRGGMSVVFLARDLRLDREVAVKALRPELTQSVGAERFQREVQLVAHFEHLNLLQLYESGTAGGVLYYVMPYARDGSLRDLLRKERQLALDDVVRITREVAEGITHAHGRGVVHRDLKPENILFVNGHAVVADFGIAHAYSEVGGDTFTDYGIAIGTPPYMSPEQAAGEQTIDHRSDVYSLGCVVYEMLTGGPPFEGPTTQAVLAKHMHERVPSLAVVRANVPRGMVAAVDRALEKVPADRHHTVAEFAEALGQGRERAPPHDWSLRELLHQLVTTPWVVAVAALIAAGAAGFPIARAVLANNGGPAFEGRPQSVLVLPYHTRASSDGERAFAADLTRRVTHELNTWRSTHAVTDVELSGALADRGLAEPTLGRVRDGIELARSQRVQAVVTLTATIRGDSARAEAVLYDAGTGRPVGESFHASGVTAEPTAIMSAVVSRILGLGNAGSDLEVLHRRSSNPDALLADLQGRNFLERWKLTEAERAFRRAVALDTTFAMAQHHLAYTLYWQVAQGMRREAALRSEITQFSTAAVRNTAGGPPTDSLLIHAFQHMQDGDFSDFARARTLLRALLQLDSTNAHGRLMLASVEFEDRWLERSADGSLAPRSNLNVAVRMFTELVRRQSGFDLGYGHLGDIYREIESTARGGGCSGFELPRADVLVRWEEPTPHQMLAFCPVPVDSLVWLPSEVFDTIPRPIAEAWARRRMNDWTRLLNWWASTDPDGSMPRTELAWVALDMRDRSGVSRPETLDSLARVALRFTSEAVALQRDTLPIDLARLGVLHLAAGDLEGALELTRRALALMAERGQQPPSYAANAFLAAGQPTRALPIVEATGIRRFVSDPRDGHLIPYGAAQPHINRAVILGGSGVAGDALQAELNAVLRVWAGPQYEEHERLVLREAALEDLAIPFAVHPSLLAAWLDGIEPAEPLWQVLRSAGTDRTFALEFVRQAEAAGEPLITEVYEPFLLGRIASLAGEHALAIRYYARLDSVPISLDRSQSAWAFQALSYLLRGEAYDAIGEGDSARAYYERLTDVWSDPDSLTAPLVTRARERSR